MMGLLDDTLTHDPVHVSVYISPFGRFSFTTTSKAFDQFATDCGTAFDRIAEGFRRAGLEQRRYFVEACRRPAPADPSKAARWFDCFRTYAEPADVTPGVVCRRIVRSLRLMPSITEQLQRKRRKFIQTINRDR